MLNSKGLQVVKRFCTDAEKLRRAEKIKNDHWNRFLNYRNANVREPIDNFKEYKNDPVYLERSEIETRILKRVYHSELMDVNKLRFSMDLRSDLKLDSLNIVVLLTEIEHEFTTVFEDKVFESVRNLQEIVDILARDEKVFW